MPDAADMTERHSATLRELTEIAMVMARGLRDDLEVAETPDAKARAVASFPAIARTVRQCVALEAKLQRDQVRQQREEVQDYDRDLSIRLRKRKAQVRLHMERAICNAFPPGGDDEEELGDEVMMRLEDLRDRLADDVLEADFADMPFHAVIATLHEALGLPPPDITPEDDPDEHDSDEAATATQAAAPRPEPPAEPYFRYSSG